MTKNKPVMPVATKDVVAFVNKNFHKNPEYMLSYWSQHLQKTIKDGFIYVARRPSVKEIMLEKAINPIYGLEKINGLDEIMPFLGVRPYDAAMLAKSYIMDFLLGIYLDNYNYGTTPCRYMDGEEAISVTWAKNFSDDLYRVFHTLAINPEIFTGKDVQAFADAYVDTLFARTQSKTAPAQNGPHAQKALACIYDKMQGMYHYDAEILLEMAAALAARGLKTDKIKLAIEKLPFEEDLGNDDPRYKKRAYLPLHKQMDLFERFASEAYFIASQPEEVLAAALTRKGRAQAKNKDPELDR